MISKAQLIAILLLEGFVTISLEIVSIRQLTPFTGNSVIVTSLVIGIFLLFLALGYRKGGAYQDNYIPALRKNIIKAAAFCGVGLSYPFIEMYFSNIPVSATLLALTIYLLIVTAPLVYHLGQTIPIVTNLFEASRVGKISGNALFVSTIGSFLGAVVTSTLLFPEFGIAATIFINVFILTGVLLSTQSLSKAVSPGLIAMLVICSVTYILNVKFESLAFIKTTAYANYNTIDYSLSDTSNGTILSVNGNLSSYIDENRKGWPYVEHIKQILFRDLELTDKNILVLGAGGFTLSAETTNGNRFTYVDIDKHIKDIVTSGFMDSVNGEMIHGDARAYLRSTNKKYDVIISDAYSGKASLPDHLITTQYMQSVRSKLNHPGIAIFNMIMSPVMHDAYSKNADATIRSVFKSCVTMPYRYTTKTLTNTLYVCSVNGNDSEGVPYTDNQNSATIDYFNLYN